jgi:dihydrofolate synthase / folylpolyglutamate synthase
LDNVVPLQNQAIDRLLGGYARFGVNMGLESSRLLLKALRDPQKKVPMIHVAGSNGKGSVCAYLSSIFNAAGYRVGRYTSPHLVSWTERICINEVPISEGDLLRSLLVVQESVPEYLEPTQFEVLTAAMWHYFALKKVDIAIVEVGLGGRLDATNVIDEPLATIITSISLEHTERLGNTLAQIAFEKAGIIKSGCPLIVGHGIPQEAMAVINRRAFDCYSPITFPVPAVVLDQGWACYEGFELFELEEDGVALVPRSLTFELPLQGAVQLSNVAVAIATVLILRQDGWDIPNDAITQGIAKTKWMGRLQWYNWRGRKILIDGAHNYDSSRVLRSFLDQQDSRATTHWVMGMLATKDHRAMFEMLLRSGDSVYLVPVPGHQSADLVQLVALAKEVCAGLERVWVFDDVMKGLQAATDSQRGMGRVVLCGSLYLLGDFLGREGRSSTIDLRSLNE